ncbi:hypothetical protein SAMN05660484_01948 [Eubacterium ruminantium]|uniref:Uncharacterized protein n=1 Tax=Eubacterium ruminantium TaxID=42322 RepID=A0A1T4P6A2_9FIRM|nr:hypothetical protein [Eubacterium ruminantium]SCW59134.1 hypothetical protein SAMN05660484_01948 [Eubacterium ruminantium]SDM95616.1 hypothetical protein SAMN04490370_10832 [Eubacterium ruminantium]SJZ87034.1 hypothetical protein SAMN02745110_01833 [Eubacterium ruminantium]
MGTKKKIILIILFPIALMIFAMSNGFFLDVLLEAIIRKSVLADLGIYGSITVISGIVEVAIMHALLKGYDKVVEKKKTLKWYFDKQLIPMFVVGITSALVLITKRNDDNEGLYRVIGAAMFPLMGITATPNVVRYALREMKNWKDAFYKTGNLHKSKDSKDFYRVRKPLPCEGRMCFTVVRTQLMILVGVILIMLLIVYAYISSISVPDSVPAGDIAQAVIFVRRRRGQGPLFFMMIFVVTFAISIIAYCITYMAKKLRVILRHEYIAYHVIVKKVEDSTVTVDRDGKVFHYKDCSCIGIQAKKINNTGATLVFIPDDVLLVPDEVVKK